MMTNLMNKKLSDYTGKEGMIYAGIFTASTLLMSGVVYIGFIGYGAYKIHKENKKEKENN